MFGANYFASQYFAQGPGQVQDLIRASTDLIGTYVPESELIGTSVTETELVGTVYGE